MSNAISAKEHRRLTKNLMKPFILSEITGQHTVNNKVVTETKVPILSCTPFVTSKGRQLLQLNSAGYLDRDQATLLCNWLKDWIGHTDPSDEKNKVDWLDDDNVAKLKDKAGQAERGFPVVNPTANQQPLPARRPHATGMPRGTTKR